MSSSVSVFLYRTYAALKICYFLYIPQGEDISLNLLNEKPGKIPIHLIQCAMTSQAV